MSDRLMGLYYQFLRAVMMEKGSALWVRDTIKMAFVVLGFMSASFSAYAQQSAPQRFDGMHGVEKTRAMRALSDQSLADVGSEPQVRSLNNTGDVPSEPVLLLLERRRAKGSGARLADAWYYSYPRNETIHKIVDLTTGVVRSVELVIDMQLPLVDAEIDRAFDVVLSNSTYRQALEVAYLQVTGQRFSDRSQVSYKAFVFHPDTVQDGLDPAARRCGLHRCAQMLLYTHDNVALDMSPVVDLSTGKALQNLELRAQSIVRRVEVVQ